MKKRLKVFLVVLAMVGTLISQSALSVSAAKEDKAEVLRAVNALLTGVRYYSEKQESNVSKWDDEIIRNAMYGKLLWDEYSYSGPSYLRSAGLEFETDSDSFWHFDLDLIQKITQDTFGRDYPVDTESKEVFVSGNELLVMPAAGEFAALVAQDYIEKDNKLTVTGIALQYYHTNSEFQGYFKAVLKENESSIYGYTLESLCRMEENQNFDNLTASASSELEETTITHYAGNVLDGKLETAWVEGAQGVGENEWITISTQDGSNRVISAIEFFGGYQKSEEHLQKNGYPTAVLIEFEDGDQQEVELYEYSDVIVLGQPVTVSRVKFTILEAAAGTQYEDTCISEIRLRGVDSSGLGE